MSKAVFDLAVGTQFISKNEAEIFGYSLTYRREEDGFTIVEPDALPGPFPITMFLDQEEIEVVEAE